MYFVNELTRNAAIAHKLRQPTVHLQTQGPTPTPQPQ